jgi:Survival motor neuron (SMN) interacting protein 1 (SIP1)
VSLHPKLVGPASQAKLCCFLSQMTRFEGQPLIYIVIWHRSEAKSVPHILVGHNQAAKAEEGNSYSEEEDAEGGYYEDGAFIAAPEATSKLAASASTAPDAQEAYYFSLATRFRELRTLLYETPPLSAIEALTSDQPISLPPDSARAQQRWRFLLQHQQPQMAQLACMDMETVLEVVKLLKGLLAGTVRSRSQKKIERLGAWIWGVLGRCSDAGQLGSEEISELRELGKRAVGLLVGIRDRSGRVYGYQEEEEEKEGEEEEGEEEEEVSDRDDMNIPEADGQETVGGTTEHDTSAMVESARMLSEATELELAKAALQEQLSFEDETQLNGDRVDSNGDAGNRGEEESGDERPNMSVDEQVCVTLDMVITIIGEVYGQRDLLEFRDMWDDEEAASSG